jgi:hypothetical protein
VASLVGTKLGRPESTELGPWLGKLDSDWVGLFKELSLRLSEGLGEGRPEGD